LISRLPSCLPACLPAAGRTVSEIQSGGAVVRSTCAERASGATRLQKHLTSSTTRALRWSRCFLRQVRQAQTQPKVGCAEPVACGGAVVRSTWAERASAATPSTALRVDLVALV